MQHTEARSPYRWLASDFGLIDEIDLLSLQLSNDYGNNEDILSIIQWD